MHTSPNVWSLQPQVWFERLLNGRLLDGWWKEDFWVSRATFELSVDKLGLRHPNKTPP